MAAKAIPRILIQAPLQNILNRRMLDGVLTYANAHGPWSINILQEGDTPFSREIAAWRPTAFMAFLEESAEATDFSELKIPSVFVNPPDNVRLPQRPRPAVIRRDYEALGRTAANYFIRRGHVSFAFVPNLRNAVRSEAICRGFADGRSELVLQNTDGTLCANAVRGYTTLPGDAGRATQRAMRKTAVRLGKYGVLKLTGDLIVSDMDLTEDTSALCLQGHKLTIRNRDNHQSTWKGKVDLGGGGR